jgi:hypothetical protein
VNGRISWCFRDVTHVGGSAWPASTALAKRPRAPLPRIPNAHERPDADDRSDSVSAKPKNILKDLTLLASFAPQAPSTTLTTSKLTNVACSLHLQAWRRFGGAVASLPRSLYPRPIRRRVCCRHGSPGEGQGAHQAAGATGARGASPGQDRRECVTPPAWLHCHKPQSTPQPQRIRMLKP